MNNKVKLLLLGFFTFFLAAFFQKATYIVEANASQTGLRQASLTIASEEESSNLFHATRSSFYSSEWEKYSSYYYYNKMNAHEKALYDKLNNMCLYYLEGKHDITNSTTPYISYSGLKANDAYKVAYIFYYSNPQYFYLEPGFSLFYYSKGSQNSLSGRVAIYVYKDFRNGSKRAAATAKLKKAINTYVPQINKVSSLQGKVKKAHDLVTEMTVYQSSRFDQSAYSTFIDHKTVCAGYAGAFSILCNAVGIDTTIVTSDTHAWNNIRLNDSWYNMDCTWDDTDGKHGFDKMYLFFNRNKKNFVRYDTAENENAHLPVSFWNGYLPSCTLDSGATIKSCGTLILPSSKTSAPVISTHEGNGKNTVSISSKTSNATIYYTLNNSAPSASNTKCYRYTGPFAITKSCSVKAIAVHDTYYDSNLVTADEKVTQYQAFTPSISSQPSSATYSYGDHAKALSVKSSVKDGGTLSYQWYKNSANKSSGGTAIKNATKSTYTPSVLKLGTTYYYCIITNTNKRATTTKSVSKTTHTAKISVKSKNIKACKVTGIKAKPNTGKAINKSFKVKNGSKTLKEGTDYKVSYKKNKNIGTATVTITGLNYYTGTCSYSFTITPQKNTVKASPGYRTLKISWKKDIKASGYMVQYSTKKSFSKKTSIKISKYATTKVYVKRLTSKRSYYIRIRSYKKVGKGTIYGPWSSIISCKVK